MAQNPNWADILHEKLDHVVIRKANRLQVIVRPSPKQLRRRGKRRWTLVDARTRSPEGDGNPATAGEALQKAVQNAVNAMLTPTPDASEEPNKKKRKKAKS